jgi:hypothetical protein
VGTKNTRKAIRRKMSNNYGIPEKEEQKIRARDKECVYCHKKMINPYDNKNHGDSVTVEHLNHKEPFNWKDDLQIKDFAICCGSCNSSRGNKPLFEWFKTKYCTDRKVPINEETVDEPVKEYINHKKKQTNGGKK